MQLVLPQVYFKSPNLVIRFDQERQFGTAMWKGHLSSTDLREGVLLCNHVVDTYSLTRWLGDNRQMKAFSPEDEQWIIETQLPLIIASPLRRMATLVSQDQAQVAAVEHMIERAEGLHHLALQDFHYEDAALQWLLQDF
ncbi:hypothetical protein [Rufibacter radiotolerans]|nr:hypothetical protein [Rufibacter radiotolerans]